MLEAARSYIHHGWSMIPLQPRGKRPHFRLLPINLGKRTWQPYHGRLPTQDEVTRWWKLSPNANIGIITGTLSGIIVLDLYGSEFIQPPITPTSLTGNGMHIFYRHPGSRVRGFVRVGMDLKGEGGYVVAPPSIHPSGRRYEWLVGPFVDLADPPDWLIFARERVIPRQPVPLTPDTALASQLNILARTPTGARNNQLNKSAFSLGRLLAAGLLDRAEVEQTLTSVAAAIGLGAREIQATLKSGLEAGMRNRR